jgi:acyl-CoA synthetase (AMP-forming)/AMP-acid ligase II
MNFYKNLLDFRDNVLFTNNSNKFTYYDINNKCDEISTYIKDKSLLFLLCSNCEEAIAGYLACLKSGSVPLLINSSINESLLQNLVTKYKPNYIWLPKKITISESFLTMFSWGSYDLIQSINCISHNIYSDLALLLMTSGSTGSPLLVRQSYRNLNSNTSAIIESLKITSGDKPITTLPFNYTYGLSIINTHIASGCEIVLTDKSIIDKEFWKLFNLNKITTFGGVPYTFQMLDRIGFEKMELSSLKTITQAGGKLDKNLSLKFAKMCEKKLIDFIVMYGQTEATARMSYLPQGYSISKAGSIGVAIPGGEFTIEDENKNIVTKAEISGELIYKGENVCLGYAECIEDLTKGDENKGLLRTGDIAKFDIDGFYYIEGRIKRYIKIFGNRVSLDEIENITKEHNFNCVCTGREDKLFIISEENEILSDVKKLISKTTGFHPTSIQTYHIPQIPRNESGKVLYDKLNNLVINL